MIDTGHDHQIVAFARWHLYIGGDVKYFVINNVPSSSPSESNLIKWREYMRQQRREVVRDKEHCCTNLAGNFQERFQAPD